MARPHRTREWERINEAIDRHGWRLQLVLEVHGLVGVTHRQRFEVGTVWRAEPGDSFEEAMGEAAVLLDHVRDALGHEEARPEAQFRHIGSKR